MYPLQLLVGGDPLAPLLRMPATTQLQAMTDVWSVLGPPTLNVSGTPGPHPGSEQQHSSDQGMSDLGQEEEAPSNLAKEPPHKK